MAVLTISQRGKPLATPTTTLPIALNPQPAAPPGTAAQQLPEPRNPLPGLTWGADPETARRVLAALAPTLGSNSPPPADQAEQHITLSDVPWLWNSPADLVLSFSGGRWRALHATVKRPPALVEAVADYEKQFGPPLEKQLARQEVSRIRWQAHFSPLPLTEGPGVRAGEVPPRGDSPTPAKPATVVLEIIITEAQGTMNISYEATFR